MIIVKVMYDIKRHFDNINTLFLILILWNWKLLQKKKNLAMYPIFSKRQITNA